MNNLRFFRIALVQVLILIVIASSAPNISAAALRSAPVCENSTCSQQKAVLRQLERTRPSKKLTRQQIFNRIKVACAAMRRLDCPDIRNYRPNICFTDF